MGIKNFTAFFAIILLFFFFFFAKKSQVDVSIKFEFWKVDDSGNKIEQIDQVEVSAKYKGKTFSDTLDSGDTLSVKVPKDASTATIRISAQKRDYKPTEKIGSIVYNKGKKTDYKKTVKLKIESDHQTSTGPQTNVSIEFEFWEIDENSKEIGSLDAVRVSATVNGGTFSDTLNHEGMLSVKVPRDTPSTIRISANKRNYKTVTKIETIDYNKGKDTSYRRQIKFLRPPPTYHLSFRVRAGNRPVDNTEIRLVSDGQTIESGRTDEDGALTLDIQGRQGDTYEVMPTHSFYAMPSVEQQRLSAERNPPRIDISVPEVTLSIRTQTVDNSTGLVTISVLAQDGSTPLVDNFNSTLNATDEITIPKPSSGEIVLVAQTPDSSYVQKQPSRHSVHDGTNQIELELVHGGKAVEIHVTILDSLSGVVLKANGIPFEEESNGNYAYKGHAHKDSKIRITAAKKGYTFKYKRGTSFIDSLPEFTVRDQNNTFEATLKGIVGGVTLNLSANVEGTSEPLESVTFKAVNEENETQTDTSSADGQARMSIDAGIGETIQLEAIIDREGFDSKPNWESGTDTFTTTSARIYDKSVSFRRLPQFSITLLDAKTENPLSNGKITLKTGTGGVYESDSEGVVRGHFSKLSGTFTAELSAEGYLKESYRTNISPNFKTTRYLLPISPPRNKIGLGKINFDVIYDSPLGSPDEQTRLEKQIRNELKGQLSGINSLSWVDFPSEIVPSEPGWNNNLDVDYIVTAIVQDQTGTNPNLSVDIHSVSEDEIIASSLIENVNLRLIAQEIRTQVLPQLSAQLPVVGYVVLIHRSDVTINVGLQQSVNQGDTFKIRSVKRTPQGKLQGYNELEDEFEVISVEPTSAILRCSSNIELGSIATRGKGTIEARFTVKLGTVERTDLSVTKKGTEVCPGAKVEWRKKGETWLLGGVTDENGVVKFKTSSGIEARARKALVGVSQIKEYPPGGNVDDTLIITPTVYTLIATSDIDCNIRLSGGSGDEKKSFSGHSGSKWRCPTGSYTIVAVAPSEEYVNTEARGQIPLPEGGKWEGAESASMDGNVLRVRIRLGRNYRKMIKNVEPAGEPEEVVRIAQQGVNELSPKSNDYRYCALKLGEYLRKVGRPEDAIDAYEKLLDVEHKDPFAYYDKAMAHYEIKDYESAIDCLEKAVEYKNYVAEPGERIIFEHDARYKKVTVVYESALIQEVPKSTLTAAFYRYEDLYRRLEKEFNSITPPDPATYHEKKDYFDRCYEHAKTLAGK